MEPMTFPARRLFAVLPAAVLIAGCAQPATTVPTTAPTSSTWTPTVTTPTISIPTPTTAKPSTPAPTIAKPTTTKPSTPAPTGSAVNYQAISQLLPALNAYYAAADKVLQAGGQGAPTDAMKNTMSGDVLAMWTQTAEYYKSKGYKQVGTTAIESFSPGEVDRTAGIADVDFCANASAVTVKTSSGAIVPPTDATKRATGGTASLIYLGGRWRVITLTGLTALESCP